MSKFKVTFKETQYWVYEYEVDADDEDEAFLIADDKYFNGEQSDNNYIDRSHTTDMHTEEFA